MAKKNKVLKSFIGMGYVGGLKTSRQLTSGANMNEFSTILTVAFVVLNSTERILLL